MRITSFESFWNYFVSPIAINCCIIFRSTKKYTRNLVLNIIIHIQDGRHYLRKAFAMKSEDVCELLMINIVVCEICNLSVVHHLS